MYTNMYKSMYVYVDYACVCVYEYNTNDDNEQ